MLAHMLRQQTRPLVVKRAGGSPGDHGNRFAFVKIGLGEN
jgi:hypothetical protein